MQDESGVIPGFSFVVGSGRESTSGDRGVMLAITDPDGARYAFAMLAADARTLDPRLAVRVVRPRGPSTRLLCKRLPKGE